MKDERMEDGRIKRIQNVRWPSICAYMNRGVFNSDEELNLIEDSLCMYVDQFYPNLDVKWFIDTDRSGKELLKLLEATDNGHAYNRIVLHDWSHMEDYCLK